MTLEEAIEKWSSVDPWLEDCSSKEEAIESLNLVLDAAENWNLLLTAHGADTEYECMRYIRDAKKWRAYCASQGVR